jgi:hypothetical protein
MDVQGHGPILAPHQTKTNRLCGMNVGGRIQLVVLLWNCHNCFQGDRPARTSKSIPCPLMCAWASARPQCPCLCRSAGTGDMSVGADVPDGELLCWCVCVRGFKTGLSMCACAWLCKVVFWWPLDGRYLRTLGGGQFCGNFPRKYVPSSRYIWSSAPIFCFCKNK